MLMTKRKPATVGEILVEEFMQPMGLTQAALAEAETKGRTEMKAECLKAMIKSYNTYSHTCCENNLQAAKMAIEAIPVNIQG